MYLHNYISPTFDLLVAFLFRFYCYFFKLKGENRHLAILLQ